MRSVALTSSSTTAVVNDSAAKPEPGAFELLIRVWAAGVITSEAAWYPTSHRKNGEARTGAVPGHEFSGVVEAVGEGVGDLEIGREVFGMNDWFSDGAMADYCTAPYFAVAPKPPGLTHVEAASAPISALTAWQGLFDRAKLQPGERVLVHGGAGAVGTFAIQLARRRGAYVITTTSAANAAFVTTLGAELVIDSRASRFEECMDQVDVVFDTVGGETLERSWSVLEPAGRMVTIAATAEATADRRVKEAFFIVEPNQRQLYEVADMLEAGQLRTVVDSVFPLPQAPEIYANRAPRQHRGKMVVLIAV